MVKNNILEENKAIYINTPKFENKLPSFLLKDELTKLRNCIDTSNILGLRDRTIIEMLYSSGLRSNELLELSEVMIDMNKRELRVIGKGDKERITFFSETAKKYLEEYIEAKKNAKIYDRNIVFANSKGGRLRTLW